MIHPLEMFSKINLYFLNLFSNWKAQRILQQRAQGHLTNTNTRVVVYTAIFGDKDRLKEVHRFPGVDYVCFTDDKNLRSKTWTIRQGPRAYSDPRKSAKIYKLLPHRFFADYEYSLWVDGTHTPIVDARFLAHKFLVKDDVAMFAHPIRKCIYDEFATCQKYNKDDEEIIKKQEQKYKNENYPKQNGLATCTVILRKHNAPKVKEAMEAWWEEVNNYSIRDQLSFNYVARRHDLSYSVIPGNVYNNHFFDYTEHFNPDRSALSVGWIFNGNEETASSRIMGYNMHEYLLSKKISSKIFYKPQNRIVSKVNFSEKLIRDILSFNINVLVFLKINDGNNLKYLIQRCKRRNIKIVYAVCDMPSIKMAREADAVIAVSDHFRNILPRRYRHKLHVAFDGYEQPPEMFKIHHNERKIKLCFISNQVWDEFPCIDRLPEGASLKIIGPNKEVLESSFKRSMVFKKSKIQFEYVPWDPMTVYQEILSCDAGIIPWQKIKTLQKIKSINRLVMFMAFGMPVIASPIPSYLKIIRHKENGFVAKKSEEWQENIIFLKDYPEKRKAIGAQAREDVARKYSKEKQGELYSDILRNILSKTNEKLS